MIPCIFNMNLVETLTYSMVVFIVPYVLWNYECRFCFSNTSLIAFILIYDPETTSKQMLIYDLAKSVWFCRNVVSKIMVRKLRKSQKPHDDGKLVNVSIGQTVCMSVGLRAGLAW